jgi:sulfocyanin
MARFATVVAAPELPGEAGCANRKAHVISARYYVRVGTIVPQVLYSRKGYIVRRRIVTALALVATYAIASIGSAGAVRPSTSARAIDPSWVHWDAAKKTATLSIAAGYNSVAGGFNFNGYNMGHLVVTVPTGAKVVVNFINKTAIPHSAVITRYDQRNAAGNFPLAFPGSASPNAGSGVANLSKPQTFSFTASTAGTYALVCGVPGHAAGGMWDVFRVAAVGSPSMSEAGAGTAPSSDGSLTPNMGTMGTVEGTVVDATSGRPIVHALVVLGWLNLKRIGETDAYGNYRIDNVTPIPLVSMFAFAEGYIYSHGRPVTIKAGYTTHFSYRLARQTYPASQLPSVSGANISPSSARPGTTVTFSLQAKGTKSSPLSAEVFAANAPFSSVVLLSHKSGDLYQGTWRVPSGAAAGSYDFSFFAALENCLENAPYLHVTLSIS